jgi:hypothetical protein
MCCSAHHAVSSSCGAVAIELAAGLRADARPERVLDLELVGDEHHAQGNVAGGALRGEQRPAEEVSKAGGTPPQTASARAVSIRRNVAGAKLGSSRPGFRHPGERARGVVAIHALRCRCVAPLSRVLSCVPGTLRADARDPLGQDAQQDLVALEPRAQARVGQTCDDVRRTSRSLPTNSPIRTRSRVEGQGFLHQQVTYSGGPMPGTPMLSTLRAEELLADRGEVPRVRHHPDVERVADRGDQALVRPRVLAARTPCRSSRGCCTRIRSAPDRVRSGSAGSARAEPLRPAR